jgi:hypothetical protein
MRPNDHADIRDLEQALDAVEQDTRTLISGLTAEQGVWRREPGSWSVSECLDHLATANRVYLRAMEQDDVRTFLTRYADIDLAGVRFVNPFIRGIRFSLATGLHVIAAHDRRHLWQAWNVRRALDDSTRRA